MKASILETVRQLRSRLEVASKGRSFKLVAVSKTVTTERIREAQQAGIKIFGENRIQEAIPKIQELSGLEIEWHFVGHLQTNKARDAVRYFSCIHSADSVKILQSIEMHAARLQKKIDLLLEVNLAGEKTKHGFTEDDVVGGLTAGQGFQWGRICGLMIIPPYFEDPEKTRPFFRRLREIQQSFLSEFPNLIELSMGMSHDAVVALEEGATMVRIGTAIFGERPGSLGL